MATREEKIKKINDELEKLSDEELEKVAGGQIIWRELIFDQKKEQEVKIENQSLKIIVM